MSHEDHQPRRASKPHAPDKQQPASDMNERARGGDKESNEILRKQKEGDNRQPQSSPGTKSGR